MTTIDDRIDVAATEPIPGPVRSSGEDPTTKEANTMSHKSVLCIASSQAQVERIATRLKEAGFSVNDISVLFPDQSGTRDFAHVESTKSPEVAITGATTAGVIGGGLGWLVGIGVLVIPGVGPFIAAGPIMVALAAAAVGATAGGITGALIGLGIPEYEATQYEGKLSGGNLLVSVHAHDGAAVAKAKEIFEREGAEDISSKDEQAVKAA